MWRVVRTVVLVLVAVVVLAIATPVVVYAPMVARCTEAADRWLAQASAALKPPPDALRAAMLLELRGGHPAIRVSRDLIFHGGCSGWSPEHGHDHMIDEVIMILPLRAWFTVNELLTIQMSRVYMGGRVESGEGVFGIDNAARRYYGREIRDLKASELECLARMTRAPSSPKLRCKAQ